MLCPTIVPQNSLPIAVSELLPPPIYTPWVRELVLPLPLFIKTLLVSTTSSGKFTSVKIPVWFEINREFRTVSV